MFVQIAIDVPLFQTFEYIINSDSLNKNIIGCRVLVNFNNRKIIGIVLDKSYFQTTPKNIPIKQVLEIIDPYPILNPLNIKLLRWASSYYHHPIGEVCFSALLPALKKGKKTTFDPIKAVKLVNNIDLTKYKFGPKALELIKILSLKNYTLVELKKMGFLSHTIKNLEEKKIIESYEIIKTREPWTSKQLQSFDKKTLNNEQTIAYNTIINSINKFSVFLINGVTGSGKTEVYLQTIEYVLAQKKQALVLVPEINLTPQTIKRFYTRFSMPIAVLHSSLSETDKLDSFLMMKNNEAAILVGTRSALFCNIPNLGIIIIDEEHDSSYKQTDGFKYNCRDIAIMYASMMNIPIVMGSATPSFESINNVNLGKFIELKLTQKAETTLKTIYKIIDMRYQNINCGISQNLIIEIQKELSKQNQVLLMLNRRGYSNKLICHSCGYVFTCNNCDINLCVHKSLNSLICHHCETKYPIPINCPKCHKSSLVTTGIGTEQICEYLKKVFVNSNIARIDRDTTNKKGNLNNYLEKIANGYYNILVGTQILAKGHHFPNVTLVGIIDIDSYIYSNDFRATEKLAQLITQVSGRTGRSQKQGVVYLQTHYPKHPLLNTLITDGYNIFAQENLKERKKLNLPPFTYQAIIKTKSTNKAIAYNNIKLIYKHLTENNITSSKIRISTPYPSLIEKKSNNYFYHILLQSYSRSILHSIIKSLFVIIQTNRIQFSIDIDPIDIQ